MVSAAAPETIPLSQLGKSQLSVNCMDFDVYRTITASSMTMSAVLFFLHLYGWNLATRANVNMNIINAAGA